MGGRILILTDFKKELRALIILIFCILSVFFVKDTYMTGLFVVLTLFLLVLFLYIKSNKLIISKNIFFLIIAILNVFTLFFVIQYLVQGEISSDFLQKVFAIFIEKDMTLLYIGWILILTSGLIIFEKLGGGKSGR